MQIQNSLPAAERAHGQRQRVARPQGVARCSNRSQGLLAEHEQLQEQLADPAIHADAGARQEGQPALRRAEPDRRRRTPTGSRRQDDLAAARELAKEDEAFAEEVPALEERRDRRRGEAAPAADPARPGRRP